MKKTELKYERLIDWFHEKRVVGEFLPNQKLTSENQLCQMFQLSRQTIRKALGILEEQGYLIRVRGSGTYLTNQATGTLGEKKRIALVTTYVDSYIFPKTIQGIENVFYTNGYSVQVSFTQNHLDREKSILSELIRQEDLAGIIIEATKSGIPNPNLDYYRTLINKKIPILFINSYYPELPIPHVALNDKEIAKKAVRYLLEQGHTKIAGLFKLDDGQGHLRYEGYLEALNEAGKKEDEESVIWVDTIESKNLELSLTRILARIKGCSALLCYNDEIAVSLIGLLKKEGIFVPAQLSVISIDDSESAILSDVSLTSVRHPKEKLGEKAAEYMLKMIYKYNFNENFEFITEIVERSSVKKII